MNMEEQKSAYFSVGFPSPLDKPLEKLPDNPIHMRLVVEKINELIERQNAIIEVLQKLAMK